MPAFPLVPNVPQMDIGFRAVIGTVRAGWTRARLVNALSVRMKLAQTRMNKLPVKDYNLYAPVHINRMKSGAFRTNGKGLKLITVRPLQGRAFNSEKMMKALIFGQDAKYYGV